MSRTCFTKTGAVFLLMGVMTLTACHRKAMHSSYKLGPVTVQFTPEAHIHGSSHGSQGPEYSVNTDDMGVMLYGDVLYVNNLNYGKVSASDTIEIKGQDVIINGKAVTGAALTAAELTQFSPINTSDTFTLGSHAVEVKPANGNRNMSTGGSFSFHIGSLHNTPNPDVYCADGMTVFRVEGGMLYFAGKKYGKVGASDPLSFDNGTVSVAGAVRSPLP